MSQEAISDEILMAYADGELDRETARAVEAAVGSDTRVADRLARFTATREALVEVGCVRPSEPVPEDLMARVRATLEADAEQTVVDFPRRSDRRWQPAALAACLALAVGVGAGFFAARSGTGNPGALQTDLLRGAGLDLALSGLPSGETRELDAGSITLIASFEDDQGNFCREFELEALEGGRRIVSVACHAQGGWDTRLAIVTNAANGDSYVPASSFDTLEAYFQAIGAGPALSIEEENQALGSLRE